MLLSVTMASRKRPRLDSGIRVQVSNASTSTTPAQTNTHIHVAVNTSGDLRSRHSVRMLHASRPADVVDLSGILATEDEEDSTMVNAQFDAFSEEDALNLAFDVDAEVVEDPEDGESGGDGESGEDGDEEHVQDHVKGSVSTNIQFFLCTTLINYRRVYQLSGYLTVRPTWTSSSASKASAIETSHPVVPAAPKAILAWQNTSAKTLSGTRYCVNSACLRTTSYCRCTMSS